MEVEFVGRHYQADDGLRGMATEKLKRLGRLLEEPIEVRVTLEKERHLESVEALVAHRHGSLQAREEGASMRVSLDLLVDNLTEQAKKARKRFQDRRRSAARQAHLDAHWPLDVVEQASIRRDAAPRIVRSSLLRIKPMTLDDASLELEAAEHGFVVYRDAATQRINVLFRRKDGDYGLIAPEF
jgi:putative sigma-54 modulation protein